MTNTATNAYNKIDTFIFFDLETSDLIRGKKMPKITELSMVATDRNSIKPIDTRNKLALPRIIHKLTIPICPMEAINPQASFASNLWNDTLENIKPFDENTYNIIMQFIERLPGSICFVAHNGNRFDYPVFLSELASLKKIFPDNILCVDTLKAFQEFFSDIPDVPDSAQVVPEGRDEVDEEEEILRIKKHNLSLDDDWNDSLCSVLDDFEKVETRDHMRNRSSKLTIENGKDVLDAITNSNQKGDFNTSGPSTPKSSPKSMQAINEKTPESQIIRKSRINTPKSPSKTLNGARKKLNFGNSKPKNFKLSTVYMHMIGTEPDNLHSAEGDCISMLRCVCQIGPAFVEWADSNAISLNVFKKELLSNQK